MMRTRIAAALAPLALLTLAACDDSDGTSAEPASDAGACTADEVTVEGGFGEEPTVTLPDDCTAPTELLSKDLVEGSGEPAAAGDTVVTNYLLETWSDRAVVDSSFDHGGPLPVENLGQAAVIAGWNQGLVGMKQGGRRLLVIPPALGYGPMGQNSIGPDETLVFVVDAVEVTTP